MFFDFYIIMEFIYNFQATTHFIGGETEGLRILEEYIKDKS